MSGSVCRYGGGCSVQSARSSCPRSTAAPSQPAWPSWPEHSLPGQGSFRCYSPQRKSRERAGRTCAAMAYQPDATEAPTEISREATMEEYLELKQFLLRRTQRSAGFITLYLLLTVSGEAALCAALGGAASYVYVAWLCADVDRLTPNDDIPMARATNIRDPLARGAAKLFAGIRQQAQPRLLVPVVLAAAVWTFNTQSGDHLTLTEEASVLLGFFSFKVAHVLLLYRELRPKFASEGPTRRIPRMDDVEDIDMDIYARGTPKLKAIEEADRVLAEQEAKKRKRLG